MQYSPISYDFITWLVRAKKEADGRRLHVVIVPNDKGVGGFSRDWGGYDEHSARWRLWHICIASCPLVGATVTLAPNRVYANTLYKQTALFCTWWPEGKAHFMGPLVDAARKGEAIPKLRATEQARRYVASWVPKSYVTLTLREQASDPARNSNINTWASLSEEARKAGYVVLRVDESNVALSQGEGYAALDPDLRLALYERAQMNFIGNNGPQELLKFSDAPYRTVGIGLGGWAEHFRKYFSMEVGEQLPWAGPQQRIVYEPDTSEVLLREFKNWHENKNDNPGTPGSSTEPVRKT